MYFYFSTVHAGSRIALRPARLIAAAQYAGAEGRPIRAFSNSIAGPGTGCNHTDSTDRATWPTTRATQLPAVQALRARRERRWPPHDMTERCGTLRGGGEGKSEVSMCVEVCALPPLFTVRACRG